MPSVMARRAERNAVGRIIAQGRVFSPRPQMVRVEFSTGLLPAILARPTVTFHHGRTECLVERVGVVGASCWPSASLPVRMCGADQMLIARRFHASVTHAEPDSELVFCGERPASQSLGDIGSLAFGNDTARRCWFPKSGSGDLFPRRRTLRGIVRKVTGHRPTGTRTKLKSAANVRTAALITGSLLNSRHPDNLSGKAA